MAEPSDFASVKLLLLGNGSNGSTSVVDSSSSARTVSVFGNAQISTAWAAFGGSSLKFDNSGDYMTAPNSADFDFGSGDFTIDFWLYRSEFAGGSTRRLIGKRNSSNVGPFSIVCDSNNHLVAVLHDSVGTAYTLSSGNTEPFPTFVLEQTAHFVTLERSGTTVRLYLDGAIVATATISGALASNSEAVCIGHNTASTAAASSQSAFGHLDDVRIIKGEAIYGGAFTPPTTEAEVGGGLTGYASDPGPLAPGALFGWAGRFGQIVADGPLGAARALLEHDWTGLLADGGAIEFYVCDLIDASAVVARVPISSWQGTARLEGSSYLQAVVPAVADLVDTINGLSESAEFSISRGARLPSGETVLSEMARSAIDEVQLDQGPQRYTCTLSGYAAAIGEPITITPPARTLRSVRSISSSSGGVRVRCAVDWFLKPGAPAVAGSIALVPTYISFFVGGNDAYMDVGQQGA